MFKGAFSNFHAANWHPLTWISQAVDIAVWGLNPWGHHLTNITLHSVNTVLVVLLVIKLLTAAREKARSEVFPEFLMGRGITVTAAASGFLFGLHPLHVESVAWISERKDLLCGFFFLSGMCLYLQNALSTETSRPVRSLTYDKNYFLVLGCFIGALLAKPMAVTFPLVLLLLDFYPLNRFTSPGSLKKIAIREKPISSFGPQFVDSNDFCTTLRECAIASLEFASFSSRVLIAAHAFYSYLQKMILPVHLVPLYPYPHDVRLLAMPFLASISSVLASCFQLYRRMEGAKGVERPVGSLMRSPYFPLLDLFK